MLRSCRAANHPWRASEGVGEERDKRPVRMARTFPYPRLLEPYTTPLMLSRSCQSKAIPSSLSCFFNLPFSLGLFLGRKVLRRMEIGSPLKPRWEG